MAPSVSVKSKAQELRRIRENQQRSRDRKRAYVAELEETISQLQARLKRSESSEPTVLQPAETDSLALENDARKELLKALGIDAPAQEQFVRAYGARRGANEAVHNTAAEIKRTMPLEAASPSVGEAGPGTPTARPNNVLWPIPQRDQDGSARLQRMEQDVKSHKPTQDHVSSVQDGGLMNPAETGSLPDGSERTSSEATVPASGNKSSDQQVMFTPCLWNASGSSSCSESKTGCSSAFSMLLANNSRGYTFADLDARLQAAYRRDDSVAEGCSVLNTVLFELLNDIS